MGTNDLRYNFDFQNNVQNDFMWNDLNDHHIIQVRMKMGFQAILRRWFGYLVDQGQRCREKNGYGSWVWIGLVL